MLEPILTEKSTILAKEGKYTFKVGPTVNKFQIKTLIENTFGVHVISVKTLNNKKIVSKNFQGKKRNTAAYKKAIVYLKKDEKIDLFEEGKKK
jgi:large subunit ribosomal protein L23